MTAETLFDYAALQESGGTMTPLRGKPATAEVRTLGASPTASEARAAGEAGMAQVAENAGPEFAELAAAFIPTYLETHGETHGEDIVDACLAQGIVPHSTKAFGPVLLRLSRAGVIEKAGYAPRRKGHLSGQAPIWRLKR